MEPREVRRIASIGTDVIRGGLTVHFFPYDYKIVGWCPPAHAESHLRRTVEAVWPAVEIAVQESDLEAPRVRRKFEFPHC